ncbi:hypothetical protein [Sinorhizobium psoraleae]|uniref:hypothetical protein n=1 Tax=Sinorhizobium psoraleae TaxID=520838 RepID=UPI0022AEE030|nr:hypothetical protein [Sinorhizobium psoraleae]
MFGFHVFILFRLRDCKEKGAPKSALHVRLDRVGSDPATIAGDDSTRAGGECSGASNEGERATGFGQNNCGVIGDGASRLCADVHAPILAPHDGPERDFVMAVVIRRFRDVGEISAEDGVILVEAAISASCGSE